MSAEVHRDVLDAVATHARSIHRPVAEVAYYARFAVRYKKRRTLKQSQYYLIAGKSRKVESIVRRLLRKSFYILISILYISMEPKKSRLLHSIVITFI